MSFEGTNYQNAENPILKSAKELVYKELLKDYKDLLETLETKNQPLKLEIINKFGSELSEKLDKNTQLNDIFEYFKEIIKQINVTDASTYSYCNDIIKHLEDLVK